MIRGITPRHKRKLARCQHSLWRLCREWRMACMVPVQPWKHLRRIRLPRVIK